jgi:hypothetical protein
MASVEPLTESEEIQMVQFPYAYSSTRLRELFVKIHQLGVPPKADHKWLSSIGFTSSNDRSILRTLKFLGLLDSAGGPTEAWRGYRGSDSKRVLADSIRKGYQQIFTTYPDAYRRPDTELRSFFKTHSEAGEKAIGMTVSTFKTLCGLADFNGGGRDIPALDTETVSSMRSPNGQAADSIVHAIAPGMSVNINIQLTLPESNDEQVYDNFFRALKKHLLPSGNVT